MSDNYATNAGSGGATFASDDVGGVQYPRVKATWGVDGIATDVSAANPMPVTNQDCVVLLSTTIAATGASTSIDTLGYGAVVIQLSGVWNGNLYFEASNDNTNWDTVLVFSRDSLSLQDIVSQSGLYTIRPSGRYLHIVTTSMSGTMTVNAMGRAAEGISAGDLLSLAMDRQNNTPLFTELNDKSLAAISPVQAMQQIGFYSTTGNTVNQTILLYADCSNFRSLSFQWQTNAASSIIPEWSNNGVVFQPATTYDQAGNAGTTLAPISSGIRVTNVYAKYFRMRLSGTSSGLLEVTLFGGQHPIGGSPTTQPVTVSSGTVTTVTAVTGATVTAHNASAVTNGTTPGTLVSAATNNLTQMKATLGRIYMLDATNTTAVTQYIKLFALPSASVTMGTTAATMNLAIPPTASGGRLILNINDLGLCLGGTGIAFAITTGSSLTDNTATTAGAVILNYAYA
jgi:hypothetical protein